jgi:predicted outer membrane repeat protein
MSFGGGGIFMLDSSPNLHDLIISTNSAYNGGGIYCANSCSIMNDLIITDNEAPAASGGGGGIYLMNCNNIIIEDVNITYNSTGHHGAGMCITGCESMTMENVILENNDSGCIGGNLYINLSDVAFNNTMINHGGAFSYGGGIKCGNSQLDFENVQISYNCASFGAGIYADGCDISIKNTMIMNNGSESGAAITADTSNFQIINSIIADNGCYEHGIISCSAANDVYIINSLLINNTAQSPNGSLFGGIDFIFNSIIWANTEPHLGSGTIVHYSDVQGGWEGEGNIDSDPIFVNPEEGDFHLQDTSPCIGAGINEIEINGTWYYAPLFDIEGNPRPDPASSMPDMGAYENPLGEPQVGITLNQLPSTDHQLTNYPNPFNPSTVICFTAENVENAEIIIYNMKGQKVKTLNTFPNGNLGTNSTTESLHHVVWDGTDENNQPVSSGIYFYKLKTDKFSRTRKMILLK